MERPNRGPCLDRSGGGYRAPQLLLAACKRHSSSGPELGGKGLLGLGCCGSGCVVLFCFFFLAANENLKAFCMLSINSALKFYNLVHLIKREVC